MARDQSADNTSDLASTSDITAVLGPLDESDVLEIAALHPTIVDLEKAATWLSGDRDIFGAGEPLRGAVAEIVAILTSDEDDGAARAI
ncbi:MAG TPA: hypothetical protein VMM15_16925 [Bradyrhizobium sp.]|nr:hypothetical protein [Bradyrhizobium sp.]